MFLENFLLVSNMKTLLFILVLFGLFGVIVQMQKRKVKFPIRMITGVCLGLALGVVIQLVAGLPKDPGQVVWLKEVSSWYGLFGNGYMDLLKMLVIPLVFVSIIRVIITMEGDNLGKITLKTVVTLVGLSLVAGVIGMFLANVSSLGQGMVVTDQTAQIRETTSLVDTLRGLLPSNIIEAMVEGNIVAIVIFASFVGIATRRVSKKYAEVVEPFVKLIEAMYKIVMSMAMTIIKYMPYGVIALMAMTLTSRGIDVLISVIMFIVVLYIGVFLMFTVHLIVAMLHGVSPKEYIRSGMEPLLLAFTSRSSLGTLPVLIETVHKKFGIDEGVASFVGSLGSNMGMNGCAGLYPALVVVMLGQMTGATMDIGFYLTLAVIIAVGSFGIVGLPGAATLALSVAVSGMGMSEHYALVGAIIAIDPILDMGRTFLNVSGTMVTSLVVGKKKARKE